MTQTPLASRSSAPAPAAVSPDARPMTSPGHATRIPRLRVSEMNLTAIHLRQPIRDTQRAHALVAGHARDPRPLWAHPSPHLLLIQASEVAPISKHLAVRQVTTPTTTHPIGARVSVSVIANPTRAAFARGRRGRIEPLPPEEWSDWITRKLSPAIDMDRVASHRLGNRGGNRRGDRVVHLHVAFHATGTVTDAAALEAMQREGIGRGKAYGAGLLLITEDRA